ncbi:amidohydrolase [Flavobacteriaceae bacterium S356]|uniref:Amidohydrolase n=1 Tax=Asprobacillus argus TaxID=3076534 RepID=A0ABU3LC12_9FLAO|nr:amidohydrolase [Flavobacteriaceae bacterium S356]
MQNSLKVAGIQTKLAWEDASINRAHFTELMQHLDVDLVVLPEMFSTGFTMDPIEVAEEMNGETVSWMKESAMSNNFALMGSVVIKENNQYYNRLIFAHPDGAINTYDKKHLFTLAGEDEAYKAGTKKLIVNYKGWKICPFVCYDLRFPVWARNVENYDLLVYVANWPSPRIHAWNTLLQARAIENMSYCVGVNRVGVDVNGYEYSGHSAAYDFLGEATFKTTPNKEEIFVVVLDKDAQNKTRQRLNFLNDKGAFTIE